MPIPAPKDAGDKSPDATEDDWESRVRSLDLEPDDAAELLRWRDAPEFEIGYKTTRCFGQCPPYELSLSHTGRFHFEGSAYIARPGSYDLDIPKEDARALYNQLLTLGYLRLKDSYQTMEDGCLVATDMPTYSMRLSRADLSKQVVYYKGCSIKGPAYDALEAISRVIMGSPAVKKFTDPRPDSCVSHRIMLAQSHPRDEDGRVFNYVIFDAMNKPVGLLQFAWPSFSGDSFRSGGSVSTCKNVELFRSEQVSDYSCGITILPQDGPSFAWPGVDREMRAALIGVESSAAMNESELSLRLLDLDSEVALHLRPGDSCEMQR